MDVLEEVKRASLLSNTPEVDEAKIRELNKSDPPPDKYYLLHLLFLVFGIISLLPMTFFLTSNQYWMYKFGDPNNRNNRTELQEDFTSVLMAVQTIPSLLTTYFAMRYGHRLKLRLRVLVTLVLIIFAFLATTAFVKVDTNSWQLGFFIVSMITLGTINIFTSILQISIMVLTSKFPQNYAKFYTLGHGMTGLFSASLQIIAISVGGSEEQTALIYFLSGTSILVVTIILFYFSRNLSLYKYYVNASAEDTERAAYSWQELKPVVWKMLPAIVNICTFMPSIYMFHPNLTTLMRSEYYDTGSDWSRIYFIPVTTFLYSDIISLIGRLVARPVLTKKNGWIFSTICVVRLVIISPLLCLCNVYTKTRHLPVIFHHDWQYLIILGVLTFLNGVLWTVSYISVPNLVGKDVEKAYPLMQAAVTLASIMSPLGILIVKIL